MENTLENKAKFFALYWGQMVLSDGIEIGGCVGDCEPDMFLELKPLSSITDEDAIEVAKILRPHSFEMHPRGWKVNRTENEIEITHRQSIFEFDIDYSGSLGVDSDAGWSYLGNAEQLFAYDYLRSKGYALPYMGLSVEKLVEYGWVKLV